MTHLHKHVLERYHINLTLCEEITIRRAVLADEQARLEVHTAANQQKTSLDPKAKGGFLKPVSIS